MVEPGRVTALLETLRSPTAMWLQLFIGGAALYAVLQSPGIGLGAIVGTVCFLLYFWSAVLGGTAGWREVLLFLAGVVCLLMEIFIFPGVAVFGLSGRLLIVVALILVLLLFV